MAPDDRGRGTAEGRGIMSTMLFAYGTRCYSRPKGASPSRTTGPRNPGNRSSEHKFHYPTRISHRLRPRHTALTRRICYQSDKRDFGGCRMRVGRQVDQIDDRRRQVTEAEGLPHHAWGLAAHHPAIESSGR